MKRAGLPMYDLPEARGATDALWRELAAHLRGAGVVDVPAELDRSLGTDALWRHPELLLAQSCGYPVARALREEVVVVATPVYDVPGCDGPTYRSFVVVAKDAPEHSVEALRGAVCAMNEATSHSGMNALRALLAPLARDGRFFGAVRPTGSHLESLAQVARGEADIASIDCVTYALARQYRPALVAETRVLAETAPAPALPYITRDAQHVDALRSALGRVRPSTLRALHIDRFEVLPERAYDAVLALEETAVRFGYPVLA